ncbi:hypothetical protein M9Y10_016974 [Tritrichomonas musculus]|uniref:F5/8 type C domain-containing protein n=1 Tax=Tritrichomonas musculus TaxID=1915356 RepID=A0ABR2HYI6_9EUKA
MTRPLLNKLKKCFFTSRPVVAKEKTEEERKSLNLVIHDKSIVDDGIINITSSQLAKAIFNNQAKNVVNFSAQHELFMPSSTADSWLTVDFNDRKVKPTFYSIISHSSGGTHPQSWRNGGSNDRESWTLLDRRTNNRSLDGQGFSKT